MKEKQPENTYFSGVWRGDRGHLRSADDGIPADQLRTSAVPYFGSTLHPAVLYSGSDSGTLCRMLLSICSAGQPDWISYSEAWQP